MQAPWNTELLREISSFPAGRHDDQIDGVGVAAGELVRMSVPKKPSPPKSLILNAERSLGSLAELFDEDSARNNSRRNRRI